MRSRRRMAGAVVTLAAVSALLALNAPPAQAFDPLSPACKVAGWVSGLVGKACSVGASGVHVVAKVAAGAGVGSIVGDAVGAGARVAASAALSVLGQAVLGAAAAGLRQIARLMDAAVAPHLQATWFSSTYWRMAGIAAMLTLPFLFACAMQCVIRSEMAPLAQAVFAYLPLSMLAIAVAAPVTMLLLAATDELCGILAQASGNALSVLLAKAVLSAGALSSVGGSPFLALLMGLFTVMAALALWIELLLRSAAVYVVVLMLPLVFAALVWPTRRVWAVRLVELLLALILSKFVIVAVLSLGGAALSTAATGSVSGLMAGAVLVLLGSFAPWAVLRLLPHAELASGAAGSLRAPVADAGSKLVGAIQIAADVPAALAGLRMATSSRDNPGEGDHGDHLNDLVERTADAPGPRARKGDAAPDGDAPRATSPIQGSGAPSGAAAGLAAGMPDPLPAVVPATDGAANGPLVPAAAETSASAAPTAPEHGPAGPPERLPGWSERWQMPNMSWPALVLGPEEPPQPATGEAGEDGAPE